MIQFLKNKWWIPSLVGILLILTLLPFILLSFYNHPLSDDYTYAALAKELGAFDSSVNWYLSWTGRYTSTILISLNPLYWDWSQGAFIAPVILIISFCFSVFYLINSFNSIDRTTSFFAGGIFIVLYFSNLHTVSESFYWMAGAFTYFFGTTFFLFTWGVILRVYNGRYANRKIIYVLIIVLIAVLAGTNELVIFYNGYLAFLLILHAYFYHKGKLGFSASVFFGAVIFGLLSLLAPGNFGRQGNEAIELFMPIYSAFALSIKKWLPIYVLDLKLLLAVSMLVLYMANQKHFKPIKKESKLPPLIVFIALFGGYVLTFLPGTLAQAGNYARTLNFSYFTFLGSVFFSILYWLKYWLKYNDIRIILNKLKIQRNWSFILVFSAFVGLVFFSKNNVSAGYSDLLTGNARCYLEELQSRHNYLKEHKEQNKLVIDPLNCRPGSLFHADVSPLYNNWRNHGYQHYFKIDTVISK